MTGAALPTGVGTGVGSMPGTDAVSVRSERVTLKPSPSWTIVTAAFVPSVPSA